MLVMKTSARSIRACATSFASGVVRFRTTLRLPRLSSSKGGFAGSSAPATVRYKPRKGSPSGGSIFTTSAPQSASTAPADGPATHNPSSTTRIPVNGPDMTLPSRRDRLLAAQEELALRTCNPRAGVVNLRLHDPVARMRAVGDRGDQLDRRLDRARPLVPHGELPGHHVTLPDEGDDGTGHLVEHRRDDAAVRESWRAVKRVGDRVAGDDAFAEAAEAKLEAGGVRRRAAEAAAVVWEGKLDVFRDGHGAEGYAPGRPDEATPPPMRSSGRSPTRESSTTSAAATRWRPSAGSGTATTCMPAARAASTPAGASSTATHCRGSTPSSRAASR